jgi:hypothetical protein
MNVKKHLQQTTVLKAHRRLSGNVSSSANDSLTFPKYFRELKDFCPLILGIPNDICQNSIACPFDDGIFAILMMLAFPSFATLAFV